MSGRLWWGRVTSLLVLALVVTSCASQPPAATPAAKPAAPAAGAATTPDKGSAAPSTPDKGGAAPTTPDKAGAAAPAASGAPPFVQPPANVAETLTVGFPSNIETIDPHQTRAVPTAAGLALVYEPLITRDPRTMELKPLLATSWKNLDPKTWEVKLRQGVKFNNGEEFEAEHVKLSFERGLAPTVNSSLSTYWGGGFFGSVEIVDKYTVLFKTPNPDPILPARLAPEPVNMVARPVAAMKDKYVTSPDQAIGSGPYKIVEHVVGDRTVFERREDYWGEKPATKRIIFKIIPDAQTRVASLQRSEVDVALNLVTPLVPLVERDQNLTVYSAPGSTTHAILINTTKGGPLANEKVRQAMNHAIDKEAILKGLYAGKGQISTSVVANQILGNVSAGDYPYDKNKAKQLLTEAGFGNGFETVLWQAQGRWPQAVEAVQLIIGFWQDVGIKTELKTLEWAEYNRRSAPGQYDTMHYYAFTNLLWDPSYPFLRMTPEYKRYPYYIAGGETLATIEKLNVTFDPNERKQLALKVAQDLNRTAAWIYLYHLDEISGLNKKVKNFIMRPDQTIDLRQTFKEQ